MNTGTCWRSEKSERSLSAGDSGGCELPDMGARNRDHVLCKRSVHC